MGKRLIFYHHRGTETQSEDGVKRNVLPIFFAPLSPRALRLCDQSFLNNKT